MKKKTVILGFVGTTLDSGTGSARWEKWRPTVAMAQHEELVVERFELLYNGNYGPVVQQVAQDIAVISPETTVTQHKLHIRDPWDFGDVYGALYDFARSYPFDPDKEEYWIHITTGTHVVQICLFLMTEARYFPGCLLQTSPPRRHAPNSPGSYTLIDLDLSRYDQIAQRFATAQQEGVAFLKSGIATRNPQFNLMIDEIEHVAVRSRAPMLLMGPTGAGKSFLARRVFELKKARHQLKGGPSSRSTAPRCTATVPGPRCSATSRAPSPAPPPTVPACCAQRTKACCFSMKSASWASTNRPCC